MLAERDAVAVTETARRDVRARMRGQQHLRAGPCPELRRTRQVVGVRVRVDHQGQMELQLPERLEVLPDPIGAGIHQGGPTRVEIRDEVGEAVLRPHLVHEQRVGDRGIHVGLLERRGTALP